MLVSADAVVNSPEGDVGDPLAGDVGAASLLAGLAGRFLGFLSGGIPLYASN
jgi:hypothetical protein